MTPAGQSGGEVACPECHGKGRVFAHVNAPYPRHGFQWIVCLYCKGAKRVPAERLEWREKGRQLRAERLRRGIPLSQAAQEHGVSVVEYSAMERGRRKL